MFAEIEIISMNLVHKFAFFFFLLVGESLSLSWNKTLGYFKAISRTVRNASIAKLQHVQGSQ